MPPVFVFYHLFIPPDIKPRARRWQAIWASHRESLLSSGLYDACSGVSVGVVAQQCRDLVEARAALAGLHRAQVAFSRKLDSPTDQWPTRAPFVPTDGRIGEGETILSMARHAENAPPQSIYLFLHAKGVTNPRWRRRKHLRYLQSVGCRGTTDEEVNDFVLRHLSNVIMDWRRYVVSLESCDFSYRLFNFFWIRASLLRRFDFASYMDWHGIGAPPEHRELHVRGEWHWNAIRHLFALFPIKLYAMVHGQTLERSPAEYIDVAR